MNSVPQISTLQTYFSASKLTSKHFPSQFYFFVLYNSQILSFLIVISTKRGAGKESHSSKKRENPETRNVIRPGQPE
jgi:hypothetical protein